MVQDAIQVTSFLDRDWDVTMKLQKMARNRREKTRFLPLFSNRPLFCHTFHLQFVLGKYLELKLSFQSVRLDSDASSQSSDSGPRVLDLSQVSRDCPFRYCSLRFQILVVVLDRCKSFDSNSYHRIRPIPEQHSLRDDPMAPWRYMGASPLRLGRPPRCSAVH